MVLNSGNFFILHEMEIGQFINLNSFHYIFKDQIAKSCTLQDYQIDPGGYINYQLLYLIVLHRMCYISRVGQSK
jgi:hypothetical protein